MGIPLTRLGLPRDSSWVRKRYSRMQSQLLGPSEPHRCKLSRHASLITDDDLDRPEIVPGGPRPPASARTATTTPKGQDERDPSRATGGAARRPAIRSPRAEGGTSPGQEARLRASTPPNAPYRTSSVAT